MNAEVDAGRPFWALLRLNEWDNSNCPVMAAARKRALTELSNRSDDYAPVADLIEKLANGYTMNDFSANDQARARSVREQAQIVRRPMLQLPELRVRPARGFAARAAR